MPDVVIDPNAVAPLTPPPPLVVQPPEVQPPVTEPDADVVVDDTVPLKQGVHPLQPGGIRFNQIYARAKGAEQELATERERRIRAEAERDLLKSNPSTATPEREYTNVELEAMLVQGQATREQVDDYKEKRLETRLTKKLKEEFAGVQREESRVIKLTTDFSEYVQAIPNIGVQGTTERKEVDTEFDWLVGIHGINPTKLTPSERQSLALNAVRNVFGPIETLRQRVASPSGEPHRGSIGGTPPMTKPNPDQAILNALTPEQTAHYEKMMRAGRYQGGWKDVVEELKYVPPVTQVVRR